MASRALVEGREVESSDSKPKPDDYVVIDGYRMVKPYHFDFVCNVRRRWLGQSIIDIFTREFPARDRAYYEAALADGRLRVEGHKAIMAATPLKEGMRMRHFIHRHEPPVPATPVQVVAETPDVVAVCKPAGMPVHVAGQYRKNTVLGILNAERPDLGDLLPVHRLDKPVSGLLLFARHSASADALRQKIEGRTVDKVYVARVLGAFPASEEPIVVDKPLTWDPVANHASVVDLPPDHPAASAAAALAAPAAVANGEGMEVQVQADGENQDAQQEQQAQRKTGKARREAKRAKLAAAAAAAEAAAAARAAAGLPEPPPPGMKDSKREPRPALTEYRLLWVAPDRQTSLVECRPRTGRTHQIRVHLQHLGHPIANDAQYGGTYGGPLQPRFMAQELGVAWHTNQQQPGQQPGQQLGRSAAVLASEGPSGSAVVTAQQQQQQQQGSAAEPDGGSRGSGGEEEEDQGCPAKRARTEPASLPLPEQEQQAVAAGENGATETAAAAAATRASASASAAAGAAPSAAPAAPSPYQQTLSFRSSPEFQAPPSLHDPLCIHCPYFAPADYPQDMRPLWLHARTYACQGGEWSFTAELPDWAQPEFVPQK